MQQNVPRTVTNPLKLQNPEQLKSGIDNLEMKLVNIKRGIEELLLSLNANEKVSWPAMLSKAASLSADLSSVQLSFKKEISQNSNDQAAQYYRNQLVLPLEISPDINPTLLVSIFRKNFYRKNNLKKGKILESGLLKTENPNFFSKQLFLFHLRQIFLELTCHV